MKRYILLIIGILISLISIFWLKSVTEWDKVLFCISFTLRIQRYIYIQSYFKKVSTSLLFQSFCLNYISNIFVPFRLGEVFRIFYMKSKAAVSSVDSIIIILSEKFYDLFIIFMFLILVNFIFFEVIFYKNILPDFITNLQINIDIIMLLFLILFGIILVVWIKKNIIFNNPIIKKIFSKSLEIKYLFQSYKLMSLAFILTLISWFFEGLMFYYAAKFIELETSFIAAFLFASFVALGSSVPSTPGSIGVFESSVLFVILLLGLDPSKGLSLGIIVHLIQVLCIVLFTIVTFSLPIIFFKKPIKSSNYNS